MERPIHDMGQLFAQLGRPNDEGAITEFIAAHHPLPGHIRLDEATFWSRSQALFLREALSDDADWAVAAESLNLELHGSH